MKHKIKRMDRLAGNPHLIQERKAIYGAITQWLLKGLPMPIILIDWSDLTQDLSQQLLRAALPVGGRSLTLYEEIHPLSKLGNRRVQHRFLQTLQSLLPADVCPLIVADSGFRVPFYREVEKLGWHWLGRIRSRDLVTVKQPRDQWIPAKSLYRQATRKPRCLGLAWWVRSNPLLGPLVAVYHKPKGRVDPTRSGQRIRGKCSRKHAKREREPWLLVTSLSLQHCTAKQVVQWYKTRMQIEEGFRDTKSAYYGLGLANESRIQQQRLANLVLVAALTSLLLWLIGTALKGTDINKRVQVNTVENRSVYSAIFLARIILQHTHFRIKQSMLLDAHQFIANYFEALYED